ncbi:Hypothetical predicted protein [Mytilus galloprovincialis]|uniref:Uncharacterized protein n=1 Tax=Mytilus galloprovincialis TaxID=29158 RepID=A0A8B6DSR6_MYTGA|nr:Hypothetical predicted protein [Mytilus galloprovincialis]
MFASYPMYNKFEVDQPTGLGITSMTNKLHKQLFSCSETGPSRPSTSETSPRPPPQGSSSTSETGPQPPYPLKKYDEKLWDKFQEGNKKRAAVEQQRTTEGKYGAKNLLDCSWRTWIKNMYRVHPGVTCICRCNKRPLISGQALIKHIERNHYINGIVQINDKDITITPPS